MKKFISGVTVLAVIGMLQGGTLYGENEEPQEAESKAEQAAEEAIKPSSDESQQQNEKSADAVDKKQRTRNKKKKPVRKFTSFDQVNDGEEKVIQIESVNFIKLKDKAAQVFVPNPKIADVDVIDDTSLYITGLKAGTTTIVVQGKDGKTIANYKVRVTYQLDEIKNAVESLYPDAKLELVALDENVIMKGKVASPEDADEIQKIVEKFIDSSKIINKMEIETATQVLLKVKIAEVSRTVDQTFGINWRALSFNSRNKAGFWFGTSSLTDSGSSSSSSSSSTGSSGGTTTGTDGNANTGSGSGSTGGSSTTTSSSTGDLLSIAGGAGKWFIQSGTSNHVAALLDALASEEFASIVAEPTLVAISGQTATFTSGGEQPYKVKQEGTSNDSYTTEFKDWGTTLEFTPIVLSENRIKITVKPKISSLGEASGDAAPPLRTKEAETTVELGSGQSLAIAGLLQTTKTTSTTRTPFFSDIPILGTLFRSSVTKNDQKEMVIIVTPYIVKPSSKGLKAPTDAMTKMYSSVDVVLKGKTHAVATKATGVLSIK